jgi:phosphoglycerate dehydrogenase-like enzyme
MARRRGKLLVAQTVNRGEEFEPLKRYADVYWLEDMDDQEKSRVLPLVDCIYSHGWPKSLEPSLPAMKSLRLYQAGNAGVNGVRFDLLDGRVTVCSNAGAYNEVAEHAIGLMLAAGKGIVRLDRQIREGAYKRPKLGELGVGLTIFGGKTIGIVGYGGIGRSTARLAKALGMSVLAFGRHPVREAQVKSLQGRKGLMKLLRESDVVVLAVPLTKATRGLIGSEELAAMKPGAILVNVARGEVVRQEAVFNRLKNDPVFTYATDVWWPGESGMESYSPDLPFLELKNFIGTPHSSATAVIVNGAVVKRAVDNMARYFQGKRVRNVVDRSEYASVGQ